MPQPGPGCSEPLQRQRLSTQGYSAFIPVLMGDTQMLLCVPFCTAVTSLSWHTGATVPPAVSVDRSLHGAALQEEEVFLHFVFAALVDPAVTSLPSHLDLPCRLFC